MSSQYKKLFGIKLITLRFLLISLSAFMIIFFYSTVLGQAIDESKTVLLINSYHKGYMWTDSITEAITKRFQEEAEINLLIEYIDWKNYPQPQNLHNFYDRMNYKYANKEIDLIIASDDAALNFTLDNREKLFSDVPIVFCGIYTNTAQVHMNQEKNITGVVEKIDPKRTLRAALTIDPNIKSVYVFHDNTETGIQSFHDVIKSVNEVNSRLNVVSLSAMSFTDITTKGLNLPKDSIILMTGFVRDIEGRAMGVERWVDVLRKNITTPIYGLYEMGLGHGIIGGSLLSGEMEGEEAANISIRILKGANIASIPLQMKQNTSFKFDYDQLEAFGIPIKKLPLGSIIINKPFSFYETYRYLVWSVLAVFISMAVFIILLYRNIKIRKKVERDLIFSHEELSDLYEELAASEEELRVQNQLLEESRNDIQKSAERYQLVFEASNEGLWELDLLTNESFFSESWFEIFDYYKNNKMNNFDSWVDRVHPDDRKNTLAILAALKNGEIGHFACEYRIQRKNGDYQWVFAKGIALKDHHNNIKRVAGSHANIHEKRIQEERIKELAFYDTLTNLPNRASLNQKLSSILCESKEQDTKTAILFIDIDNFKIINDAFGHTFGDILLMSLGERLQEKTAPNVYIGRLGGDEFLILYENVKHKDQIEGFIKNVIKCFEKEFVIDQKKFHITSSIGVAIYPEDGTSLDDLLKNADTAMYRAKQEGKNCYRFFEPSMNEDLEEKLLLQNGLRYALERNEFTLYYQPEIETGSGNIYGFEALIRWISPEHGFIQPLKFIEILEETGLIADVGKWVIKEACEFAKEINSNGKTEVIVSVNVSPIQLTHSDFVDSVKQIIKVSGVSPRLIGFEITETALMESFSQNIEKLYELKELGIRIILDDFGTGYSSLNYLRKLPISILKIDKSFVDDLMNEEGSPLTASIVSLAHSIGLRVVAEGVETATQFEILKKYHCDLIQGYLISKPVPKEETKKFLNV
ncbi:diguanylate cyclase (GGDEF)-like protein/PAS domain S-box-containing protein [Anaerosolibacter carboniphilus]|uniref:Diguanylate cyclase (GGDEF)-like protein/PAS domain S-box-containing protein n=1 Tax=Anaerosolibacter carboniphilus TaxID=1417629 RepID=A0A841KRA3_9FIRM|nr:GGDEF domain-containing phosphodiesterase [Anaerosolibacter carboniphilus]MBB6215933.1 diguanylate cyclase (GGDEF)-like protein/PAS domain S-box-containing protein [Anaerosolibacter carboniphilus]